MTLLSERASHATVPSIPLVGSGLRLPADLQRQLYGFRSLIWKIKSIEAVCGAVCGVIVGYLTLFAVDRLLETPQWIRIGIFAFAFAACTVVPVAFHHWIWGHRSFDQLARLLSRRFPSLGDQLLGVIEIVRTVAASNCVRGACARRPLVRLQSRQIATISAKLCLARGTVCGCSWLPCQEWLQWCC